MLLRSRPSTRHIELRHLRYFVVAAECGSFRKAGMAIGIKASGVSRRVRELEGILGSLLFHRHHSGLDLTPDGGRFLQRARKIIGDVCDSLMGSEAAARSSEEKIKVGIVSSLASGFMAELLREYRRRHNGVQIEIADGRAIDHVPAIQRHEIDVAFMVGQKSWMGCDATDLWSERLFVAFPVDHGLIAREAIDWHDLKSEAFIAETKPRQPILLSIMEKRFSDYGFLPNILRHDVEDGGLLPLVALGFGLTLVSESTIVVRFPGVAYRPLRDETLEFRAVWSSRNENPALRKLLRTAKVLSDRYATER